jgi:hypothetical protein
MNTEQLTSVCSVPGCHDISVGGTKECTHHRNAHHERAYKYNKVGAQAQTPSGKPCIC